MINVEQCARNAPSIGVLVVAVIAMISTTIPHFKKHSDAWCQFAVLFVLAQVLNEMLKRALKHDMSYDWIHRPNGYDPQVCGVMKGSSGMPSGHTQAMFFLAMYVTLFHTSLRVPLVFAIPLWIVAVAVGYSRVRYECHTVLQVVIGAVFGIALASACFFVFR